MNLLLALTFAFHYQSPLTAAQLRWFSRFDVLVTHDPLPRAQVAALHEAGTKLYLYEWAVAFYDTRATPWERSLIHTGALLNAAPLRGGAGSNDADAWYFDPVNARDRAKMLAEKLRDAGYDGTFLDTTTAENVLPAALDEFKQRHPGIDYDAAFAKFLAALKRERILIFTNQGYRSAPNYLPYADWDLTESLIGSHPWKEVRAYFEQLPRDRYPRVHFAHLEYANPGRTVAIAKMFGGAGYVGDVESPLYFAELGKPLGARVDRGDASYRLFANGIAAVNDSREPLKIGGLVVAPGESVVRMTKR
jgi:hypothetical protein